MAVRFVVAQQFFGAADDGAWQASEFRRIDAVAFLCAAGTDLVEKDQFSSLFSNLNVKILDARQDVCQLRQFVVVRGEESLWAYVRVVMYVFEDRARNRQPVISRSPASEFV